MDVLGRPIDDGGIAIGLPPPTDPRGPLEEVIADAPTEVISTHPQPVEVIAT